MEEAGVDGGGLFKDFMEHLVREVRPGYNCTLSQRHFRHEWLSDASNLRGHNELYFYPLSVPWDLP